MNKSKLFVKVCGSLFFSFLCLFLISCDGESSDNVQDCDDSNISPRCQAREENNIGN